MFEFRILKKSKKSRARLGILKTSNGEIETPAFVPVATRAAVKTLTSEEARAAKCQMLIANTFHLHLRPGEKYIKLSGGLHNFMQWNKPLMTDSGGFQVFSLGFGSDLKVGKILKYYPGKNAKPVIKSESQPKQIKINSDGVYFRSLIDGAPLFLGPRESIKIQEALGADIIFAFDECTSPLSDYAYVKESLGRTHEWAKICLMAKKSKQALFGITQGSHFKDLREESARYINSLDFAGFGIGGDLGGDKKTTSKILDWTIPLLNEARPRHLLGIGYLEDMENIVRHGIDTFDCTVPTHYARRGIAFVSSGKLNMRQAKFLSDKNPLDKNCECFVCKTYRRNYISHLFRAGEITALKLLTFHNLFFFNTFVKKIREKIKSGKL